ncbi:MAG: DeoR/GlpR family DNA-binding transcription regulator [Lachnospiraceae bacterium]|nr:DeoR/GlpR family DNA-binding transcription regulator [Lachnospiraceae bacterium]
MKTMTVEERQNAICEYVNDLKRVHTNDLINHFEASASTIRNDLVALERSGLIRRTHGMVMSVDVGKVGDESAVVKRMDINMPEKMAIAALANQEIEDGDVIMLMTGSTLMCLAHTLVNKKNLTIVVNDVNIAQWLLGNTDHKVFILGGFVRRNYYYVNYDFSITEKINVDKAFFSSTGFSLDKGATISDYDLAASESRLLNCANQTYLLIDSAKFGEVYFAKVCSAENINMIITDGNVSHENIERLRAEENIRFAIANEQVYAHEIPQYIVGHDYYVKNKEATIT